MVPVVVDGVVGDLQVVGIVMGVEAVLDVVVHLIGLALSHELQLNATGN